MTNTKHTPAPWYRQILRHSNKYVVQNSPYLGQGEYIAKQINNSADAYLIAAAPELLELLNAILMQNDTDGAYCSWGEASLSTPMRLRVIDTIAKAKGE